MQISIPSADHSDYKPTHSFYECQKLKKAKIIIIYNLAHKKREIAMHIKT